MAGQGAGYAAEQNRNQSAVAEAMTKLLPNIQNLLAMQSKTGPEYEAARQNAIAQLINVLNPANLAAQDTALKQGIKSDYGNMAGQAELQAESVGASPAAVAGIGQGMAGQAARQMTAVDQRSLDPVQQSQRVAAWLSSLEQAQRMPGLQDFSTLASTIYGQPKVQVQPGLGEIIGSVAGGFAGNPGLFKHS